MRKILALFILTLMCVGGWAQRPEDGKVYVIENYQKDGSTYPFYVTGSLLTIGTKNKSASEYDVNAQWLAESRENGKFSFKNLATGEYLVWKGSSNNGYNDNNGTTKQYVSTYCDWTLTSATGDLAEKIFYTTSKRNNNTDGTLAVNSNGTFNAYNNSGWWTDNGTNYVRFTEIESAKFPEKPLSGKVYTIFNDHLGIPYYLNNTYTNNCTAITATKSNDNTQEWIMFGDDASGYSFYNVSNTANLLKVHEQHTSLVIKDERAKVGYTIARKSNSDQNMAGSKSASTLSGGQFTGARYNEYNNQWSTDFVFIPTGEYAYKVVADEDATVIVNEIPYANGQIIIADHELSNYDISTQADGTFVINGYEIRFITTTDIETLQAKIDAIYDNNRSVIGKLGYPSKNNPIYVSQLYQYSTNPVTDGVTAENYFNALNTLNKLYTTNDFIVLPEDGKAYTIKAVWNGGEDMLYYDETSGKIKGSATTPDKGHIFICRKTGDNKFLFVNEYGKYLTWGSSTSVSTNTSAVVDEYSKYADITIARATPRTNGDGADVDDERRFGLVTLQAFRANTETLWYSNYIHGHPTNNFVESGSTSKWYDGSGSHRTHMYRIEEVEYPYNTPKLANVSDEGYASVYLPFAMTIPAGVEAYAATGDNDEKILLNIESDGTVAKDLPAGGYILHTEGASIIGKTITIVPAASDPEEITNKFIGSTLPLTEVPENAWGLGAKNGIGFYKYSSSVYPYGKALYISQSMSPKFAFGFDDDDLTGINNATNATLSGQLRDLMGNLVINPIKGQLYIQNGKVIKY